MKTNPSRNHDGGTPIWAMLIVALVLALIGVVALGYTYLREKSAKGEMEKALLSARVAATNALADRIVAAQRIKATIAENKRAEALSVTRGATNRLYTAWSALQDFNRNLDALMNGDPGKPVSRHPDLVRIARGLLDEVRGIPAPAEAQQKLEAARRVEYELENQQGSTYEPDFQVQADLQQSSRWADRWLDEVGRLDTTLESLEREAAAKLPPAPAGDPNQTLAQAIDALTAAEERFRAQTIALADQRGKEQGAVIVGQATEELVVAENVQEAERLKIRIAELESELQREREQRAADQKAADIRNKIEAEQTVTDAEADRMRAKAQQPDVQDLIKPFTTPGYLDVRGRMGARKKPVSYSELTAFGALKPDFNGLRQLQEVAGRVKDTERPRLSRKTFKSDPAVMEQYDEIQALLIELGPTLVELGLLEP